MSSDKNIIKNFTKNGESQIYQGSRNVSEFLPEIFKTSTNKKFIQSTLDNLLSSGSTESLEHYWGIKKGKDFDYKKDSYINDIDETRKQYQFAPGFSSDIDGESVNASYPNIISNLRRLGYKTEDIDKLFRDYGYVLDLPINLDMFVNYTNYFWFEQEVPVCEIVPTEDNPINIDDILPLNSYTTPVLANGKTLTFVNGMRVKFTGDYVSSSSGDYKKDHIYIVEGIGTGNINLIHQITDIGVIKFPRQNPYSVEIPSEWDVDDWNEYNYDYSTPLNIQKEYVVINRNSKDKNAWSRKNQWVSIYALKEISDFTGIPLSKFTTQDFIAKRPIIEFKENLELYNNGTNFRFIIDHHVDDASVGEIEGRTFYNNNGKIIEGTYYDSENNVEKEGHYVLVTAPNQNYGTIYKATYANEENYTNLVLTPVYTVSDYEIGDKFFINHSSNDGFIYSEVYWNGEEIVKAYQTSHRSDSPLFQLYDHGGNKLNSYNGSTFFGNEIFKYKTSDSVIKDMETNINLLTDSISPKEYIFEFPIFTERYNKNSINNVSYEIKGDYFYKNFNDNNLYSVWKPTKDLQFSTVTKNHVVKEAGETVQWEINPLEEITDFVAFVNNRDKLNWTRHRDDYYYSNNFDNETLVFRKNLEYNITFISPYDEDIEFFDPYGNSIREGYILTESGYFLLTEDNKKITLENTTEGVVNILKNNYTTTLIITDQYEYDKITYRSTDGRFSGTIIINEQTPNYKVFKNGELLTENVDFEYVNNNIVIITEKEEGDIFEVEYITLDSDVEKSVSPLFDYNPNNETIREANISRILPHFHDQMQNMPGITNTYGETEYHRLYKDHSFGGRIRQQLYSPLKHSILSLKEETEPLAAITQLSYDYSIFKQSFKRKVNQLWHSRSYDNVQELVDDALRQINIGKDENFKYADSDMVYYDDPIEQVFEIEDENTFKFSLNSKLNNRGTKSTHLYVWMYHYVDNTEYKWVPLQKNTDFVTQYNDIILLISPNIDTENAKLKVHVYEPENSSFIPPSSVKSGFTKLFDVRIYDNKLQCHDGSIHELKDNAELFNMNTPDFDVVSSALYDLETRIYNNINDKDIIDIKHFLPRQFLSEFDYEKLNECLIADFNNWKAIFGQKENILINPYDSADPFTWNYQSVGTGFASYRSIYRYVFGTYRPHTHPWEMLGYNEKPSWWDTNYGWEETTKRENLINALKKGIINSPEDDKPIVDPKYAIVNYDWNNNTLVTTDGELNDPVTANVVNSPAGYLTQKSFEFGDLMFQDEMEWYNSSDFIFSLVKSFMKLKPFRIHEIYWKNGDIFNVDVLPYRYEVFNEHYTRETNRIDNIHLYKPELNELTSVSIDKAGSEYNFEDAYIIAPMNSKKKQASIDFDLENGEISDVVITDSSSGYQNNFSFFVNETVDTAVVSGFVSPAIRRPVFGINLAVKEYTNYDIINLLNSINVSPIIHLGGFSKKDLIDLYMDNSYRKNNISIPKEDFDLVLNKNPQAKTVYYSGIRFEKTKEGYIKVSGFNPRDKQFYIYPVNENAKSFNEPIDNNFSVIRYVTHRDTIETVPYNTVFKRNQDLYNFMLGLQKYYEKIGFRNIDWVSKAEDVISWSIKSDSESIYYENGIKDDNSIVYEHDGFGFVDEFKNNTRVNKFIVDKNNKVIDIKNLLILRGDYTTEIKPKSTKDDNATIYGIEISFVSYEHLINIKRQTRFGDIIYDTLFGIPRDRIKVYGERTRNWKGKLNSNGYIVSDNSIIKNFDTSAREIETDILSSRNKSIDTISRKIDKFTVGYQDADYFIEDLKFDEITSYEFSKGTRNYKGTNIGIQSFVENQGLFGSDYNNYELLEEWLIKLNKFGDLSNEKIEIEIPRSFTSSNPQIIRFDNNIPENIYDGIIDISEDDIYYISGNFEKPFPTLPPKSITLNSYDQANLFKNHLKNSGMPLKEEVDYLINSISDIESVYDFEAEYANIPEWSSNISYTQGDIVRYGPNVYKLIIETTGYDFQSLESTVRGNVTFPEVPSGSILDFSIKLPTEDDGRNVTITFEKTDPSIVIEELDIVGTVSEPVLNDGDIIEFNITQETGSPTQNYVINFSKKDSQEVYQNINVTGNNENPQFTGSDGDFFIVDGVTIDMSNTQTVNSKLTVLDIWKSAFNKGDITETESERLSSNRVQIFKNLCEKFIEENTTTDGTDNETNTDQASLMWTNWVSSYFSGIYETSGLNINYLISEYESLAGGELYEENLKNLIEHDLQIINGINSTSYQYDFDTNTFSPSEIPQSELDNATNLVSQELYLADIVEYLKSDDNLIFNFGIFTTIIENSNTIETSYGLSAAVSKINSALIVADVNNVRASVFENKLRITKTNINDNDNTLEIGQSPLNSIIGFPVDGEVYQAQTSTIEVGGTFNLDEIVSVINSENIPNITANVYTESARRYLRIRNNNKELFISNTPVIQKLGLGSGLYISEETTQIIEEALGINEIINQINSQNITGVSALNVNNSVVLNINAENFRINQGTANEFIGFQVGEISSNTIIDNTFKENEWQKISDPLSFSVWVQNNRAKFISDNITQSSGYNVYQVFDFEYEIEEICAGEFEGDDALVKFFIPHDYSVGDHVVITGSKSIPNVDGIHRITKVVDDFAIMIEEYIEQKGEGGKVFSLLPTRFPTTDDLVETKNNPKYFKNNLGWKTGMYAYVDSYDDSGIPAVYRCSLDIVNNEPYFDLLRTRNRTTDNSKIVNAVVYNYKTGEIKKELEVFDPIKNIIPGIAEKEIDIKSSYDIATYTNSTDPNEQLSLKNYWAEESVGKVWWDLNNTIYLDYEQSTLQYRQENWGKLYETSSIDIYEWTKSPVPPDEYEDSVLQGAVIDGVVLTGTPYFTSDEFENIQYYWTEETKFNKQKGISETYYYFWVKNKTTVPNNNRIYPIKILSEIVRDPTGYGILWLAAISENSFLVSNIEDCLSCENAVLQINFDKDESLTHQEYLLLSENSNEIIPDTLHKSMRESLSQYSLRRYQFEYSIWNEDIEYYAGDVVKYKDGKYYIAYSNSLKEEVTQFPVTDERFGTIEDSGLFDLDLKILGTWDELESRWDSTDWDSTPTAIYTETINRNPEPPEIRNNIKFYNNMWYQLPDSVEDYGTTVLDFKSSGYSWDAGDDWDSVLWDKSFEFDIDNIEGKIELYSSYRIPDNLIHPSVRYDINTYEKSMIKNINDARREFITSLNRIMKTINIETEFPEWRKFVEKDIVIDNYTYNLKNFYIYENWVSDIYNSNKSISETVNSLQSVTSSLSNGDYVKVLDYYNSTPRYKIYEKNNNNWELVYQKNGTIQFIDELWNQNGYTWDDDLWDIDIWDNDLGIYVNYIFDLCRNYFFKDRNYRQYYNKIWFDMLNYIHSEQDFVDWAKKSTFIKPTINRNLNEKSKTFKNDGIDNLVDYINKNKPYSTKIKELTENNNIQEEPINANVIDTNNKEIEIKYNRNEDSVWQGDIVLKGGDNWEVSDNNDYSLFTTVDFDYEYVSGSFEDNYDLIEEKAQINAKESFYIEVTRNTNGDIEDNNTVFYINHNNDYYNKITDDNITEIQNSISPTDTSIEILDSSVMEFGRDKKLSLPYGVAWINGEKILYKNIQGNILRNCIRGMDNTVPQSHQSGSKIYNGSYYTTYIFEDFDTQFSQ